MEKTRFGNWLLGSESTKRKIVKPEVKNLGLKKREEKKKQNQNLGLE